MNSTNPPTVPATDTHTGKPSPRPYRSALCLYHPNGKGTGSAAKLEVVPATGNRDGAVYLTLALQKSVASGSVEQGNRQYPTFDWAQRVIVKLNFDDLCHLLPVLRGMASSVADGKGLFHDSRNHTTLINLSRVTDSCQGVLLEVSRRAKTGDEMPCRVRILFSPTETYGIGVALEQSLGVVAFGIPREFRVNGNATLMDSPGEAETSDQEPF